MRSLQFMAIAILLICSFTVEGQNSNETKMDNFINALMKKMTLNVLETNKKAIDLYTKFGFEIEGVLKNDKLLSDGKFYDTVVMGRFV